MSWGIFAGTVAGDLVTLAVEATALTADEVGAWAVTFRAETLVLGAEAFFWQQRFE